MMIPFVRAILFLGVGALLVIQSAAAADDAVQVLIDGPEADLTLADLKKALLSAPAKIRSMMLANPGKIKEVISSTYAIKVAASRARKKQLDKDPEISAKIWNRSLNILAGADVEAYVEKLLAAEGDFETAAKEEYLSHKESYMSGESVDVSHILIKGTDQRSLEKARKIYEEIASGQIGFEQAVERYSEDMLSKKHKGRLGKVERGRMVKSFEDVAFTIEPGKISQPVKSRFGYHLILVHIHVPTSLRPFEQVKGEIIRKLKKQMEARIRRDYWMKIEDDEQVRVNDTAIEAFVKHPTLY